MRELFNDGWEFKECTLFGDFDAPGVRGDFCPVRIPHDWMLDDVSGLYRDSTGWYRKVFSWDGSDGHVFINFDGLYMDSRIYVGDREIAQWKYGYSPCTVELTDYLSAGDNELRVRLDYRSPNTRWYSGAGIFRNVTLIRKGKTFIPQNGVYISTRRTGEDSFILHVETEIAGEKADAAETGHKLFFLGLNGKAAPEEQVMRQISGGETTTPALHPGGQLWRFV